MSLQTDKAIPNASEVRDIVANTNLYITGIYAWSDGGCILPLDSNIGLSISGIVINRKKDAYIFNFGSVISAYPFVNGSVNGGTKYPLFSTIDLAKNDMDGLGRYETCITLGSYFVNPNYAIGNIREINTSDNYKTTLTWHLPTVGELDILLSKLPDLLSLRQTVFARNTVGLRLHTSSSNFASANFLDVLINSSKYASADCYGILTSTPATQGQVWRLMSCTEAGEGTYVNTHPNNNGLLIYCCKLR